MSTRPEDLLAAYADHDLGPDADGLGPDADGLGPDDRARVEQYLAKHPAKQAEVDELQAFISGLRASARAELSRADEPDWSDMRAAIHRACKQADAETEVAALEHPALEQKEEQRGNSRIQRLRAWLQSLARPRAVAGLGTVAIAAVMLVMMLRGSDTLVPPSQTSNDADNSSRPLERIESYASIPPLEGDIAPLESEQLDELLDRLAAMVTTSKHIAPDPEGDLPLLDDDLLVDEPTLAPEIVAEWIDDEWIDSDIHDLYASGLGLDAFPEPDYDEWLGDLSENDLDALDKYLEEIQAG